MAIDPMYPSIINSPIAKITTAVLATDTLITIDNPEMLPPAPNLFTILNGVNSETVLYTDVTEGVFTCQRGFQGTAKDWSAGQKVARLFTSYDYETLRTNLTSLSDIVGEGYTTPSLYIQPNEPSLATEGSIWIDTDGSIKDRVYIPAYSLSPTNLAQIDLAGNIKGNSFPSTGEPIILSGQFFIPPQYMHNSYITPFIIWSNQEDASGSLVLKLEYTWPNYEESLGAATTIMTLIEDASTKKVHKSEFDLISGSLKTDESMILFSVYRDPNHASDTFNSQISILGVGFEFFIDKPGIF